MNEAIAAPQRVRALGAAVVVAAIVGIVFPYATLRLGFGPNTSLFATLLGFVVLSLVRARGRMALHAAHAAGVAAGQTAFMGVAFTAVEILRSRHALEVDLHPSAAAVFAWLTAAGALGVLAAVPLRRHYIEDEKLGFAAGAAAGETILALEARGGAKKGIVLGVSAAASVALTLLRPAGGAVSPLGVGTGMLVGLRMAASMAIGAVVLRVVPAAWVGAAPWAASALMVAGGMTTVALGLPAIARLPRRRPRREPLADARGCVGGAPVARAGTRGAATVFVVAGVAAVGVLCGVDRYALGVPFVVTLASIALAAPLLLVGTRVLGETNWAPVLALAAVAQAALAVMVPQCVLVNMVGSAVAGAIPNGGQHMMQSLRAAKVVGAGTRDTMIAQLVGVVVGALALTVSYPLLLARFGVGEGGLASPFSVSWAAFSEAFASGSVPEAARVAIAAGGAAGVVLALLERRFGSAVPAPTAIGVGLLLPVGTVGSILAGAVLARVAERFAPRVGPAHAPVVASGLVAGEAIATCAALFVR